MGVRVTNSRFRDPEYLAWLRKQPCACGCHQPPPCDAAHLRAGSIEHGKPHTGMQIKPDDCWAMPLKHAHHMAQHAFGDEVSWWHAHGVHPFVRALRYYGRYLQSLGMPFMTIDQIKAEIERRKLNQKPRKRTTIKPRLPREERQKIHGRSSFPKGRKIRNRHV